MLAEQFAHEFGPEVRVNGRLLGNRRDIVFVRVLLWLLPLLLGLRWLVLRAR